MVSIADGMRPRIEAAKREVAPGVVRIAFTGRTLDPERPLDKVHFGVRSVGRFGAGALRARAARSGGAAARAARARAARGDPLRAAARRRAAAVVADAGPRARPLARVGARLLHAAPGGGLPDRPVRLGHPRGSRRAGRR